MSPDLARSEASPISSRGLGARQRAQQLAVLDLGGRGTQPPDAQADVVAFGFADGLEVPAVVELGRRKIGQLAVLELADVAGDAPDLLVAQQLRDVERRERCGRRAFAASDGDALALQLHRRGLQLPGGGQAHPRPAPQEHQVVDVAQRRQPAVEADAVAALAEVAPARASREYPIVSPGDVPAMIDDQREPANPGGRPLRQVVEPRDCVAPVGAGLDHDLAGAGRRVKADAGLERPGRLDRGAPDGTVGLGVHHDAVVGSQQIGGPDRVRANGERRLLDERAATGRQRQHRDGQPARARAWQIDPLQGSCYLLTHLGIRGAARARARSGPPVIKGLGPLQTPST